MLASQITSLIACQVAQILLLQIDFLRLAINLYFLPAPKDTGLMSQGIAASAIEYQRGRTLH